MAWKIGTLPIAGLVACVSPIWSTEAFELSEFGAAIENGKATVNLRYRYEMVDQNNALRDAKASILRTRLGYKTDDSRLISVVVEGENITSIGAEKYNSTTNGRDNYSVVADPETTEINQAYLKLKLDKTVLKIGRQRMILDNGRFLGNVGFRQNEQTYDAAVVVNSSFPGHRITYAYMDKANRFLGDEHPIGDFDMSSHFLNYQYKFQNGDQLSAYAYLLEMEVPALIGRSTRTFGARYSGGIDIARSRLLYTTEIARQLPYAFGSDTNRASYATAELGLRFASQWQFSIGIEYMAGDGTYAFQTPLATAHAFAGFADIFAGGTPPNGLVDRHIKLKAPVEAFEVYAAYHDFGADNGDQDYGTEWDLVVSRSVGKYLKAGIQFSSYNADQFAVDTDKAWFWIEFKF